MRGCPLCSSSYPRYFVRVSVSINIFVYSSLGLCYTVTSTVRVLHPWSTEQEVKF